MTGIRAFFPDHHLSTEDQRHYGIHSFCSDPAWDKVRSHNLINHFTTAFLLAELKQDENAAAALAPVAVEFAGVTYKSQGYKITAYLEMTSIEQCPTNLNQKLIQISR